MSNDLPYPQPLHPLHAERDAGGRFLTGNAGGPGRPAQTDHSRLRVQAQRAIAADFLRHMEDFLAAYRKEHRREYLALALQALDEGDDRPGEAEEHAPTGPPPNVQELIAEGRERAARAQAELKARVEAATGGTAPYNRRPPTPR
jgi:hypothetical protein